MLQRSPDTLRRYETDGLIPPAPKFDLGQQSVRLYSVREIRSLVQFFDQRNPVGRPSKTNFSYGVNKIELRRKLSKRFKALKEQI